MSAYLSASRNKASKRLRLLSLRIGASAILAASLMISALAGCAHRASSPDGGASYNILKSEQVSKAASEDPEEALQAVTLAASLLHAEWAAGDGDSYASRAAETLAAEYFKAAKDGEWTLALRLYASLDSLSRMEDSAALGNAKDIATESIRDAAISLLLLADAQARLVSQSYASGISRFLDALDSGLFTDRGAAASGQDAVWETASDWMAIAAKAGDASAIRAIAEAGKSSGVELPVPEQPPHASFPLAEQLKGVVTVFVDRGLSFKNGIGYPDRIVGTAFQIDPKGYFLTNYHVVATEVDPEYEGFSKLSIRPSERPEMRIPASVVGWNEELDIALLKSAEPSAFSYFPSRFARSNPRSKDAQPAAVREGELVQAIGSPAGLENSIASGIVSAVGRKVLRRGGAIQIDAPVNPGNSGSPLLKPDGSIVGMIFAGMPEYQGLNFALPSSWIAPVIPNLFDGGDVKLPWLGLRCGREADGTLSVVYAFPGGLPLAPGDVIVAIDGVRSAELQTLQEAIVRKPLGALARVVAKRGSNRIEVLWRLGAMPRNPLAMAGIMDDAENFFGVLAGVSMEHLSGARGEGGTYRIGKAWPGMAADESGIMAGDIVKLLRLKVDEDANMAWIDLRMKSPSSGYLERTVRLVVALETTDLL